MDAFITVSFTGGDPPPGPPSISPESDAPPPFPPDGGHRHVSIGNEAEGKVSSFPPGVDGPRRVVDRHRPPALVHIPSHRAQQPSHLEAPAPLPPRADTPLAPVDGGWTHAPSFLPTRPSDLPPQCSLHLSLSVTFAPKAGGSAAAAAASPTGYPGPPLALTLHSGSLASLYQFGVVYAKVPPLPMPDRAGLARYYHAYHAHRVEKYAEWISREMDVRDARLVMVDDNINDEMIGMMERGEMDGNVFRRMVHHIVAHAQPHARPLTQHDISHLLAPPHRPPPPPPAVSSAPRIALAGVYLERLLLQSLTFTVWEGADLGAARGLRLAIDSIDVVGELQEERAMACVPSDALKHSKLYFDLRALAQGGGGGGDAAGRRRRRPRDEDRVKEVSKGLDFTHGKGSDDGDGDLSPYSAHSSSSQHSPPVEEEEAAAVAAPSSACMVWSLSNVALRMSRAVGEIVYNAKWMEMQQEQEAHAHDLTSSSSRVVLATYENERYTLGQGWSARNLLPTDRPAWSNAAGTEEVTKESLRLPSDDWQWESDWQKDFYLRKTGEVDEDGWEYAHDFPRQYSRVRKW